MERVVVAMSGGVDSSVAAALVAEAGYDAVGVTLRLLGGEPTGFGCCGSPRDVDDARRVAEKIGIPHYVLNFDEVFESSVIERFVADYIGQRTPNPCVECNRSVKFGALLRLAQAWGAAFVATGHYARVAPSAEGATLLRAIDEEKDQTYFLYSLTQKELARVLFPVGALLKSQVREKARALGLTTADKEESQEICFVPGGDYRAFVRERAPQAAAPGEIRDENGRVVGEHGGLFNYTIGQRKGLQVSSPRPLYVTGMDATTNTLRVGAAAATLRTNFVVEDVSWTAAPRASSEHCGVRIRHRGRIASARWKELGPGRFAVELLEPQRAVAPGQAAVFYARDVVLGGGTIGAVPDSVQGEAR